MKLWVILLIPGSVAGIMNSVAPIIGMNALNTTDTGYLNKKLSETFLV